MTDIEEDFTIDFEESEDDGVPVLVVYDDEGNEVPFKTKDHESESHVTEVVDTDELNLKQTNTRNISEFHNVGRLFEDFQDEISGSDIGDWELTDGSMEKDTDIYHGGGESLKLTADSTGQATLVNDAVSVSDINPKKSRFAIMVRVPPGQNNRWVLRLRDSENNRFQCRGQFPVQDSQEDVGFLMVNCALDQVTSAFDPNDIKDLLFRVDNMSENDEAWVDSIRLVPVPQPGCILLDFDAGIDEMVYDTYRPILAEYGYSPSIGNSDWGDLGESGNMTEEQALELVNKYGYRLRPHVRFRSMFDESGDFEWPFTDDEYEDQLLNALEPLWDLGIREGIRHFSFLGNDANWESLQVAQDYALTGRWGRAGPIGYPANPLLTNVGNSFDDGITDDMKDLVDYTAEWGGFYRIYAHADERLGEADLRGVLDYIQNYEENGDLVVSNIVDVFEDWKANARNFGNTNLLEWDLIEHFAGIDVDSNGNFDETVDVSGYNEVKVRFRTRIGNLDQNDDVWAMRINENSSTDYDYVTQQGSTWGEVTGDDKFVLANASESGSGFGVHGEIEITDDVDENRPPVSAEIATGRFFSTVFDKGYHDTTGAVNSIQIWNPNGDVNFGRGLNVEVFGR